MVAQGQLGFVVKAFVAALEGLTYMMLVRLPWQVASARLVTQTASVGVFDVA